MAALEITITLNSPLISGEPRRGAVMQTQTYLPGSVLRGAAAAVLMSDWTPEQRAVAHPENCPDRAACSLCSVLFPEEGEPPRFSDCHPALPGSESLSPFPSTAFTCKRFPGFLDYSLSAEERLVKAHGIFDTLIRQAAARDAAAAGKPIPYWFTLTCPHCDEPLLPPKGPAYGVLGGVRYSAHPIVRRFSRTAINRRRGTAQHGQLFTLEVIGEQMKISPGLGTGSSDQKAKKKLHKATTSFAGQVETGGAAAGDLKQTLQRVQALGSGASRGMGQVAEVRVKKQTSAVEAVLSLADFCSQVRKGNFSAGGSSASLVDRIASFNAALTGEREFYRAMGVDVLPGAWYFTVDLLSPTFTHAAGLATLLLTPEMLGLQGVTLNFSVVESLQRGGWSNAWGLPRARQVGMAAGSVFMYRVDTADADEIALIVKRLHELEETGIGSERVRGAGRLLVCAPFHQEVEPV